MKAVIIGGGIAGLAAAKGLQLLGWEVQVYEQASEHNAVGAGIVLSANALRALQALRLYEAVQANARELAKFSILNEKGSILSSTNHLLLSRQYGHSSALAIHRGDLQQSLLSQTDGLKVHTGKRCQRIHQTEEGVEVTFSDGSGATADILLGCDGIHSAVRQAVFPAAAIRFAGYTCWRGISEQRPAAMHARWASESWGRGQRFGLVPLKEGKVYWFACQNTSGVKDPVFSGKSLREVKELFAGFHPPVQEVLEHTPSEALLLNDIMDLQPLASFTQGRVVLLGDAAHATTPNMGQGACQALEDAAVLGALLGKLPYSQAFAEYNRLRISRTQRIVKQSWQLGRLAQLESRLAVVLRNGFMRSIPAKVSERQMQSLMDVQFEEVGEVRVS